MGFSEKQSFVQYSRYKVESLYDVFARTNRSVTLLDIQIFAFQEKFEMQILKIATSYMTCEIIFFIEIFSDKISMH